MTWRQSPPSRSRLKGGLRRSTVSALNHSSLEPKKFCRPNKVVTCGLAPLREGMPLRQAPVPATFLRGQLATAQVLPALRATPARPTRSSGWMLRSGAVILSGSACRALLRRPCPTFWPLSAIGPVWSVFLPASGPTATSCVRATPSQTSSASTTGC